MKIVLFEYATGGGFCDLCDGDGHSPALAREGELMLRALGAGLAAMDDVRLITVRDKRLPPPDYPTEVAWVHEGRGWRATVARALDAADAFWPVAPETGGLLADLCRLAQERRRLLLNSPASVVEEAGAKHRAFLRLRRHGVRCVDTRRLEDFCFPCDRDMVVKPDDGVGCEATYLLRAGDTPPPDLPVRRGADHYGRRNGNASPSRNGGGYLCQPYWPGDVASLSVVYAPAAAPRILGVNRQEVALQGRRFRLRACHVNALAHRALDFERLAAGVQRGFSGIVGYVGIDFIVAGDDTLHVLEVNPRVTSSFVGLAASTGVNPCAEVLRAVGAVGAVGDEGGSQVRAHGATHAQPSRHNFIPVEVRFDGHLDGHL